MYAPRAARPLGLLAAAAPTGTRRVRWRAENVHHFAWSTSPHYIYEGGSHEGTAIHVLYQPGDTAWDAGVAVQRTANALAFLDTIFGPYPYPQVTNVHRIEGGGTEFPMMVMDGSASQGLIMHEVGHIYLHGILANNEWREGWLDEGFVSFIGAWFTEDVEGVSEQQLYERSMEAIEQLDRTGASEPISLKSADFRDFDTYNAMTYTKPQLVLRMLRHLVGDDATRRALRDYYERYRFRHVTEAELRAAFERASGQQLDWFFRQWIHTTHTLDYAVGEVATQPLGGGRFRTRVQITRRGEAWMPVVLQVGDVRRTLDTRDRTQTVEIETRGRPDAVVLDPDHVLIDIDRTNNRKTL